MAHQQESNFAKSRTHDPRNIVTSAAIANYDYRQMHRGTMKCDNSFPMTINYRINSDARERGGRKRYMKLPFLRNQLFCFVAKAIAFRSNRIFFRDWWQRGGREEEREEGCEYYS